MKPSFETFGPIPSRRLGRSLGLNNIPPKICSYSCIYCQIGNTTQLQIEQREFYSPEEIAKAVKVKIDEVRKNGECIDYLSFVPDGEPTLDINLGKEIELLKPLGIKIAVITNGSLLWQESVRKNLSKADWVCLKIDALSNKIWSKINRAHKLLKLKLILQGMVEFACEYEKELTTDTMLVKGINDSEEEINKIADFIVKLKPAKSYLAIPIRPPAETLVELVNKKMVAIAYQIFSKKLKSVELLIESEENTFVSSGKAIDDLLSIVSVHPMQREAVKGFLQKAGLEWKVVEKLIRENRLKEVEYQEKVFYTRC